MISKGKYIGWIMAALCMVWQGCSLRTVEEAQAVVAKADSLRAQGQMYSDSATLAQAYGTLHRRRAFYPDAYAHCCYHYGRLLREKDDPVAAMQVFINATHSRTDDYHILGRVYSNMGSICRLGENYYIAHNMYKHSSDMFLQQRDSILYFYGLNNMAFDLAELGKKEEALSLLDYINENCIDKSVIAKTWETKAELYRVIMQYDSAIYCVNQLQSSGDIEPTCILIKAQSFSLLGEKDSALLYAKMILDDNRSSSQNKFNTLYIITHFDSTLCASDISDLASQREDIRYYEYEPKKARMSKAIHVLEQELAHKPDLAWLYTLIITLAIVGVSIVIYVQRKHKKQELLVQKLEVLQHATSTIQEKHDELKERYMTNHKHIEEDINNRCSMLQSNEKIKSTLAWKNYDKMCMIVDKQFYLLASKLRSRQCLNETEVRLCILTLLNCGYDQMAELLYHSTTSIGTLKMRVAKKLGTTSKQLRQYLIENECIR